MKHKKKHTKHNHQEDVQGYLKWKIILSHFLEANRVFTEKKNKYMNK